LNCRVQRLKLAQKVADDPMSSIFNMIGRSAADIERRLV
jgi:hypothetical protein